MLCCITPVQTFIFKTLYAKSCETQVHAIAAMQSQSYERKWKLTNLKVQGIEARTEGNGGGGGIISCFQFYDQSLVAFNPTPFSVASNSSSFPEQTVTYAPNTTNHQKTDTWNSFYRDFRTNNVLMCFFLQTWWLNFMLISQTCLSKVWLGGISVIINLLHWRLEILPGKLE